MEGQFSASRNSISSTVIALVSTSGISTSKVLSYPTKASLSHDDANSREYYKKYEHDELPVKDVSDAMATTLGDGGVNEIYSRNTNERGDSNQVSLTKSDIDKIEENLAMNISNQLLFEERSLVSLESNIQLLKSTVQDIFNNYFTSLEDFELYKQRFNDIIRRNRNDETLLEMEGLIQDMIKRITSDSLCSSEKKIKAFDYCKSGSVTSDGNVDLETLGTYSTHEGYITDHTEDIVAIPESDQDVLLKYLLLDELAASVPVIDRNRLSGHKKEKLVASTDNIKMQAKKQEVEMYMLLQETGKSERDIPVRTSCAKKDIRLCEKVVIKGFGNKSYLSRLCNFLCRQFRKSA